MSDDPSRPLPGSQSDPTPAADAPAWWAALGRGDLPLDSRQAAPPPRSAGVRPTPPRLAAPSGRRLPWRAVGFNLTVLLVALLIVCLGVGVISPSMFLTAALIFGVPLLLAAVTAAVVTRRSR